MSHQDSAAVIAARKILGNGTSTTPAQALQVAKDLKKEYKFGYARRLLNRVWPMVPATDPDRIELAQQRAICTYKDIDIPAERRLHDALCALRAGDDPDSATAHNDTLGIAGAIWKRSWEVTGRKQDLERSLVYYETCARRGVGNDLGYTAVNAAFVLDLLAHEDRVQSPGSPLAESWAIGRREAARAHRQAVVRTLPSIRKDDAARANNWWFDATLAEAQFGLGEYAAAKRTLEEGLKAHEPPEWERESTTRQLAAIARLRESDGPTHAASGTSPWEVLGLLVDGDVAGVRGHAIGKVGLALSGGGFRASLFHIGVLARLAELDLLRHVEVLSCVSGGSIVGAHYYLKLKAALEEPQPPDRQRYIRIVQDLERDFLAGVQRNIRTRLFAELGTNLRMLFQRGFTRTKRAGELFEEEIYSLTEGTGRKPKREERPQGKAGEKKKELYMEDLLINPPDEQSFHPLRHNWRRAAKVPVLILNATTLNTGHAWQFTATWMGEPPRDPDDDIDGNYRLRRLYYREAPEPYRSQAKVRVGHAVAASAAVPGLFEPLDLPDLFEHPAPSTGGRARPILVRLVDGGVHDNQGVASLTDQECVVQLVSDASGQLADIDHPSGGPVGVLFRSASAQGARVRTAQYDALAVRRRPAFQGAPFVLHLKRGLTVEHVDWRECSEPYEKFGDRPTEEERPDHEHRTFYGSNRTAQALLAGIRTDLDSFSDAEAYALMLSGYRMASAEATRSGLDRVGTPDHHDSWEFHQIEHALSAGGEESPAFARLKRLLEAAGHRFFKPWRTLTSLRLLRWILLGATVLGAGLLAVRFREIAIPLPRITVGSLTITALMLAGTVVARQLFKWIRRIANFEKTIMQYAVSVLLAAGGFALARLHLEVFDRLYLGWGRIDRFQPRHSPERGAVSGGSTSASAPVSGGKYPAPAGPGARAPR